MRFAKAIDGGALDKKEFPRLARHQPLFLRRFSTQKPAQIEVINDNSSDLLDSGREQTR